MCGERPKSFVIAKLSDTLRLVFPEIICCYYMIDQKTKEEYVITEFKSYESIPGSNKTYEATRTFKTCVTADSNAAMIEDVWKAMKERFY